MGMLDDLGLATPIWTMPVEIEGAIPFDTDDVHASYDAEQVARFWRALIQMDRVFEQFRSEFVGKVSPVHLFWEGEGVFYSYSYPEPDGYRHQPVAPEGARYDVALASS